MDDNTAAQRRLYPELVCDEFEEIIELGQTYDALGCKVSPPRSRAGFQASVYFPTFFEQVQHLFRCSS